MSKAPEKIKEEFLALLPPTIFFFIALNIVALVRRLMTEGTGLPPSSSAAIAVGALIIGKAVFPPHPGAPDQPLSRQAAGLQHRLEDADLLRRRHRDPLSRAAVRRDEAGGRHSCGQPEAAGRDDLAALHRDPDHPAGVDPELLRDPRTRARAGRAADDRHLLPRAGDPARRCWRSRSGPQLTWRAIRTRGAATRLPRPGGGVARQPRCD